MRDRAALAYLYLREPNTQPGLFESMSDDTYMKRDAIMVATTVLSAALELPWPVARPGGPPVVYHTD
jgi:hypothetical protein